MRAYSPIIWKVFWNDRGDFAKVLVLIACHKRLREVGGVHILSSCLVSGHDSSEKVCERWLEECELEATPGKESWCITWDQYRLQLESILVIEKYDCQLCAWHCDDIWTQGRCGIYLHWTFNLVSENRPNLQSDKGEILSLTRGCNSEIGLVIQCRQEEGTHHQHHNTEGCVTPTTITTTTTPIEVPVSLDS